MCWSLSGKKRDHKLLVQSRQCKIAVKFFNQNQKKPPKNNFTKKRKKAANLAFRTNSSPYFLNIVPPLNPASNSKSSTPFSKTPLLSSPLSSKNNLPCSLAPISSWSLSRLLTPRISSLISSFLLFNWLLRKSMETRKIRSRPFSHTIFCPCKANPLRPSISRSFRTKRS